MPEAPAAAERPEPESAALEAPPPMGGADDAMDAPSELLLLGQEALKVSDWQSAGSLCAQVLSSADSTASRRDDARLCLAEAALALGQLQQARAHLESLEAADPRQLQQAEQLKQRLESAESSP